MSVDRERLLDELGRVFARAALDELFRDLETRTPRAGEPEAFINDREVDLFGNRKFRPSTNQ